MNPLNERLDEIGWASEQSQSALHTYRRMFNWMQQATAEIDRLTDRIERLEEEADA